MGKNFEVSLSLGGTDPPFSFLILLHVGLWVVIFICDRVLQYQHHQSQAKGYLEFFRETKELRRIPHAILSLGLVTFSQHYQYKQYFILQHSNSYLVELRYWIND